MYAPCELFKVELTIQLASAFIILDHWAASKNAYLIGKQQPNLQDLVKLPSSWMLEDNLDTWLGLCVVAGLYTMFVDF